MDEGKDAREFLINILEKLNSRIEGYGIIRDILTAVKDFTRLEAVAIRLREGDDYPYFSTLGLPESFVAAEKYLCPRAGKGKDGGRPPILECMCGNVIQGRTDPALPFFTAGGSFWCNHTSRLLAETTERERKAATRNRCNAQGYESVALIPLRSAGDTIGLLQLVDTRKDRFEPDFIPFMERVGNSVGVALHRGRAEDIQKEARRLEGVIATAGAVCHELNQPLMTLSGYVEMILCETPENAALHPVIRAIREQAERMTGITSKLGNIIRFESADYVGGRKILDIEKSSAPS